MTNDLLRVRLLIGDMDDSNRLVADAYLGLYLSDYGNPFAAAAAAADDLAAKYAREVDVAIGEELSLKNSQLHDHYAKLAGQIRQKAMFAPGVGAMPFAGGIYTGDTATNRANTALNQPAFARDTHSNVATELNPTG